MSCSTCGCGIYSHRKSESSESIEMAKRLFLDSSCRCGDCCECDVQKLESRLKSATEALEFIAPMEQDEEFPVTRISKASKRARQALEQIKKG